MNFSSVYNSLDSILKVLNGAEVIKNLRSFYFKWEWGMTESLVLLHQMVLLYQWNDSYNGQGNLKCFVLPVIPQ